MAEDPHAVAWDEAYNATDTLLIGIEGLIHAAFTVADQHPALGGPQRETAALRAVLDTLREKNEALREARDAEYRAGLQMQKAPPRTGSEHAASADLGRTQGSRDHSPQVALGA